MMKIFSLEFSIRTISWGVLGGVLLLNGCNSSSSASEKVEKQEATQGTSISPEQRQKWFKNLETPASDPGQAALAVEELVELPDVDDKTADDDAYPVYEPHPIAGKLEESVPELPFSLEDRQKILTEFNFDKTPLNEVVAVFGELLEFNYMLDGELPAQVSLSLKGHLSKREVWNVFQKILQSSGAYSLYSDKLIHIRPLGAGGQGKSLEWANSELKLEIFPLSNISIKGLSAQLTPFLTAGNQITELENINALLLIDTPAALEKIGSILRILDQPSQKQWAKIVIPCRNVAAANIADELGKILPVLGFAVAVNQEKASVDAVQLVCLERLQILIASAASKDALVEVQRWAKMLDQNDVGDQERIYLYHIQHGQAEELVKAISMMFPVEASTMSYSNTENATRTTENKSTQNTAAKPQSEDVKSDSVYQTPVTIFADAVQNRLIIRTAPRTYTMLKALLEKIDTVPPQVLLQVLVVEVSLNDSVKFGVEFMMKGGSDSATSQGGTNYKNLAPGADQESQFGGKYWIYNPDNPEDKYAYVNSLATQTNVKVISSPQILVVSHNEAEITVGNTVPIVNSEITNTQSSITSDNDASTNLIRNIKYEDTGIILKVTPHVTRGGAITLEMEQTVSEALNNKTSNIDSPEIQKRILKTTMSLMDNQTVICGGIIREKVTDNLDTLPIVNAIPFLRRLVGDTDVATQRTEMLVLVSAQIVTRETKLEKLLTRYEESINGLVQFSERNSLQGEESKKSNNLSTWFFE